MHGEDGTGTEIVDLYDKPETTILVSKLHDSRHLKTSLVYNLIEVYEF